MSKIQNNAEPILYTAKEVACILHTNVNYVYQLMKKGFLPYLKLGSAKVRRTSLENFLEKYEGYDLTDLSSVKKNDDLHQN